MSTWLLNPSPHCPIFVLGWGLGLWRSLALLLSVVLLMRDRSWVGSVKVRVKVCQGCLLPYWCPCCWVPGRTRVLGLSLVVPLRFWCRDWFEVARWLCDAHATWVGFVSDLARVCLLNKRACCWCFALAWPTILAFAIWLVYVAGVLPLPFVCPYVSPTLALQVHQLFLLGRLVIWPPLQFPLHLCALISAGILPFALAAMFTNWGRVVS
jgi:hypothetical protein